MRNYSWVKFKSPNQYFLPFIVLLFFTTGHQGDHDGAVLGCHGDAVLMDLKSNHTAVRCLNAWAQTLKASQTCLYWLWRGEKCWLIHKSDWFDCCHTSTQGFGFHCTDYDSIGALCLFSLLMMRNYSIRIDPTKKLSRTSVVLLVDEFFLQLVFPCVNKKNDLRFIPEQ